MAKKKAELPFNMKRGAKTAKNEPDLTSTKVRTCQVCRGGSDKNPNCRGCDGSGKVHIALI